MAERKSVSFLLIVACLLAAGVVLIIQVNSLNREVQATPSPATGSAAIVAAARQGDTRELERLIATRADVNAPIPDALAQPGESGMTPLMFAALSGKAQAVEVLLNAGAKVDARARDGRNALMYAAGWSDAAAVRSLIDAGARLDARSEDQRTALMLAASRGTTESLDALIAAGANMEYKNRWGQTALIAAALVADAEKVNRLLRGSPLNATDANGLTALNVACGGSDESDAVVDALLQAGADPKIADNDGVTPLMRAADRGNPARVAALIKAGAPLETRDQGGRSALDWALARDDEAGEAVARLLREAM